MKSPDDFPASGIRSVDERPILWTAADVAKFLRLPSEDMARRRVLDMERKGARLRVPAAICGRRFLVHAARLLAAAGFTEAEIRHALEAA